MDFYQEQYSYTLARRATVTEDESDEETSWVMMTREGEVVKLPGEKIYYKVRSRIGLDLATPKALPNSTPFSVKSDSGIVYITNNRVIYLPAHPTEAFKSFSAPILDFEDTRVASSFFGPWSWNAVVKPTVGGGIPSDVPRLELKLTFKEGGHDAFQNKFEIMKERLSYARTLQRETGQIIPTGEDLPRYEATAPAAQPTTTATATTAAPAPPPTDGAARSPSSAKEIEALERFARPHEQQAQGSGGGVASDAVPAGAPDVGLGGGPASQSTPDEPPPNYEEAQAQAIDMRFEESVREAADRQ